jgi:hypothetical protein
VLDEVQPGVDHDITDRLLANMNMKAEWIL